MRTLVVVCLAWGWMAAVAEAQVCQLRTDKARGSAVCVGVNEQEKFAIFLTAGHCCEAAQRVEVAPVDRWLTAKVLAYDASGPGRDLAILRVNGYCPERTYVLAEKSPPVGSAVTFAGFARGGKLQHSKAVISRHRRGYSELSEASIGGESGGPVLVGPRVVGIITHVDDDRHCLFTNLETIRATLAAWGQAPNDQKTGFGMGVGVGGYCTPYGCYPARPAMPEERPQDPGWPGFASRPPAEEGPATPSRPVDPFATPPAGDAGTQQALNQIVARLDALQKRIENSAGTPGPPGPAGPRGPMGLPGIDGASADPSALEELRRRVAKLEATEVPIQIVNPEGAVIEEDRVPLGQPIRLKLVPTSR